jgi:predicted lysophospholipase L1 biosynthesis ABC-type transport system permease subunit
LDKAAPNWEHSIKDVRSIGDFAIVTAAITIDGITREGIGTGSARSEVGIKKAEHDALKRAAVKFGIARDLYRSEEASADEQPMETASSFNGDPIARTMSEMVSTKQLGMIRAVAREANLDGDLACRNLLRCEVNELSRRAASFFIDHLRELNTQAVPFKKAG